MISKLNSVQYTIIEVLSDGLCHSGTELGETLGISRSAIWKHVKQLIEIGIPIISIPQQGYHLKHKLILLSKEKIIQLLANQRDISSIKLHLFSSIDSTNRYLKDLPLSNYLDICCAEQQTQGRGRFGRTWHSPFGENIYCSSRWKLDCNLAKLSGLSLITSLAVVSTLKRFTDSPEIKIKWPNDILWRDKKLCGSLIEIIAESNALAQIVIGVGLNVNSDTENHPLPDKPWCSLYEISDKFYDRNEIIAHLIINLNFYLTLFLKHDLYFFMKEWEHYDYLMGKRIKVTQNMVSLSGHACGIDSTGQLILRDEEGNIHLLSSGDTSLQGN